MTAPRDKSPSNNNSSSNSNKNSGNVRVVARIRPLATFELENGAKESLTTAANARKKDNSDDDADNDLSGPELVQALPLSGDKRWFELDAVFDKNSTQEEVYEWCGAKEAVCESIFSGFNCTILAYGQTGAGKTYSMGSAASSSTDDSDVLQTTTTIDENAGMIPRAVQDLFQQIEEKCDGNAVVELSYLEIYNEALHDLLAHKNKKILRIHEHMNGEVYVSGLTARTVTSPQEVGALMEEAASRRIVASNAMNAASSRSHAICVLRVKGLIQNSNTTGSGTDKFTSKLTLVDLAGSERLKKTGSQGCRRKEGININKSLLVLGQVVSALADRNKKHAWRPPYRDSKLTRLLQDSLGGNCRTIMLACVSPADCQMEESLNTLRYATSARNIKNTATRNILKNISPEEAASLLRENQLLKKQVEDLQHALQLLQQGTQHLALKDGMVSEDEQQQQQQRRLFAKMTSEDVPDNFTRDVDDSLQLSHGRPQISTHCQDQRWTVNISFDWRGHDGDLVALGQRRLMVLLPVLLLAFPLRDALAFLEHKILSTATSLLLNYLLSSIVTGNQFPARRPLLLLAVSTLLLLIPAGW